MKKNMIWVALAALVIPTLARGLWFYRGIPNQPKIATPDYQSFSISQPPLATPANEKVKAVGGVVLFDMAHVNQYQSAEVQTLQEEIAKRDGKLETITDATLLEQKLKYASAYVVISPSTVFADTEIRLVKDFVNRGGRLLVFTDATRGVVYYDWYSGMETNYADSGVTNPLLSPFGITVNNDYLYNVKEHEGNYRNIYFDDFGKDELTFGLKRVAFYGAHSVKSASGLTLFRGDEFTLSSVDDAHHPAEGGAAISEDGNVLAFGDFTFLTSPYHSVADNATLIANIADFTLSGKQTITLANFPYLFTQSVVQVYPTSEIELTAETIAAIGGIQQALRAVNVNVEVADKAPRGGDTLVLGTFTPSDDLAEFTEPFNIELSEEKETIVIKKFGEIGRTGNGLLLFDQDRNGNTLTLLSDTQENLVLLLTTLGSGSLSGCILQDNLAVCGVGYGSYSEETTSGVATEEPTSENATPVPEATPAG
jgi:hypothetical protein